MLWRHRGCFWRWTGSYYQLTNDETIHAIIWGFLEKAFKLQWNEKAKKWERVPVQAEARQCQLRSPTR